MPLPVSLIRPDLAAFTLEAGACKDSPAVLDYINKARRLIWQRGDWFGTVEDLKIRSYDGILTLPPKFEIARNAAVCHQQIPIDNKWYDYVSGITYEIPCFSGIIDRGTRHALFRNYTTQHRLIIEGEDRDDKGKLVGFETQSPLGHRFRLEGRLEGDHEKVKLNEYMRYVVNANKDVTNGRVLVYIYDPNNNVELLAGVYEATDTIIALRRYNVPMFSSVRERDFYVKAKKRYHPLVDESELVEFPVDALAHACNAVTHQKNKETKEYADSLNLAVEILQNELKENQPSSGQRIKVRHSGVHNLNH